MLEQATIISRERDRFGLGYLPTNKGTPKTNQKYFRTLQKIFHSVGFNYKGKIVVIEETSEKVPSSMRHCLLDTVLNN